MILDQVNEQRYCDFTGLPAIDAFKCFVYVCVMMYLSVAVNCTVCLHMY